MSECCRLQEECIMAIVRNRSGMFSGEIDYSIKCDRLEKQSKQSCKEILHMLDELKEHTEKRMAEIDGFGWNYVLKCPSKTADHVYK